MNIGYMGEISYRTVIEHTNGTALGINEDAEACVAESALMEGPPDLPCLNTSVGVRNLLSLPELYREFNREHGIVNAYPTTHLYGFIGQQGVLSDMVEMTFSTRFLTGEIGPHVGFVQGTGLKVKADLLLALPNLGPLLTTLDMLEYRGEITLGLTDSYQICSIEFGHFTGGFSLYNELCRGDIKGQYEWCLGVGEGVKLHNEGIAVTTLLSYPPYPHSVEEEFSIKAPSGAEKHLYRMAYGNSVVAYSAAWGNDIHEAKRRCRKTIDNCKSYNKDIQYRIDYGHGEKFVLSHDRYLGFGGVEPRRQRR